MLREEEVRFPAEGDIELSAWLFVPEHCVSRLPAFSRGFQTATMSFSQREYI